MHDINESVKSNDVKQYMKEEATHLKEVHVYKRTAEEMTW